MNTHFPSLDFDLGEDIEMLRESVYQFARLEIAATQRLRLALGSQLCALSAFLDDGSHAENRHHLGFDLLGIQPGNGIHIRRAGLIDKNKTKTNSGIKNTD